MRIYVINFKRFLRLLPVFLIIVLLLSFISVTGMEAFGVFDQERDLPIYSVDTPDRKVSITFDCAWGAVP